MPENTSKISYPNEDVLTVLIRTRNKVLFDGTAKTISCVNDTGPFDILPRHANFITLIRGSIIIDKLTSSKREIRIDNGVLYVSENRVSGYIGI